MKGATNTEAPSSHSASLYPSQAPRATRHELDDGADPYEFCREMGFADPLPVIPPTVPRVEKMLEAAGRSPEEVIGLVPPCYGPATVEKIAANAVMAGCEPAMMRVLIPLIRAACDERFNLHGLQATTHFAAPLVILNGPIRGELGFVSGGNLFSNVARANSTLGRAFQLILSNIGGGVAGEIDMSTFGNPGKFSFVIAENEEQSPWAPFHTEFGFKPEQSALTLFGAEAPTGVSEHTTRDGAALLKTICYTLATCWSPRLCGPVHAVVLIGPEHAKTLRQSGIGRQQAREILFQNTGVPLRIFDREDVEGSQYTSFYTEITIDGEPCYQKFGSADHIHLMVAGGTAGKFSAVLSSWIGQPYGSQMVTYPIGEA